MSSYPSNAVLSASMLQGAASSSPPYSRILTVVSACEGAEVGNDLCLHPDGITPSLITVSFLPQRTCPTHWVAEHLDSIPRLGHLDSFFPSLHRVQ